MDGIIIHHLTCYQGRSCVNRAMDHIGNILANISSASTDKPAPDLGPSAILFHSLRRIHLLHQREFPITGCNPAGFLHEMSSLCAIFP